MAARVAPADYDQLHHFVAVGPWDEAPLVSFTDASGTSVAPRFVAEGRGLLLDEVLVAAN